MTQPVPNAQPEAEPSKARRSLRSVVWRALAIVVIVAAMIAAAHFLSNPARLGGGRAGAGSAAGKPSEGQPGGAPPARSAAAPTARAPEGAVTDLRREMAGVLGQMAEEDGPDKDPTRLDPESRRRFLADRLRLPFDFPRSEAPADVTPKGAETLAVFENPTGDGARMALFLYRADVHRTLSEIQKQYAADGWAPPRVVDPDKQTDQGWLLRFSKGGRERIVYARPRPSGNETLLAIYDSPH